MSVTGVSGANLVQGSLTLTRGQAEARGMKFYETKNQQTGERTESYQVSLSGYSLSLLNADVQKNGEETTQRGDFVERHYAGFGPTQGSLYRMDALRTAAAEDRPAVEQAFANCLEQAGIDPKSSFTMTRTFNETTREYQVNVGPDYAKSGDVENLLNNNAALRSDVLRVWNQQDTLADMRIVEKVLQEGAAGGQGAINKAWQDHGRNDLALSKLRADTLVYRGGQIVAPSMEVANTVCDD